MAFALAFERRSASVPAGWLAAAVLVAGAVAAWLAWRPGETIRAVEPPAPRARAIVPPEEAPAALPTVTAGMGAGEPNGAPRAERAPFLPEAAPRAKLPPASLLYPEIARLVKRPERCAAAGCKQATGHEGKVARVIDGDTIAIEGGPKIRLTGVNTPERGQPLYEEATAFTASLVAGRAVRWLHDREARDAYGRDLAYVFADDGRFVQAELVRRGYAYCYRWEPNTHFAEQFLELQRLARADGLGLWSLPPPPPCAEYVSETRSHVFHRPDCRHAEKIPASRCLRWSSRTEALDTGRNPCRDCNP
jgi:endonuclease YncB( thermonuclease family)